MNSKLGRQRTMAPLAAPVSPFMSLLYPPNPWCEWCDVWRLITTTGSTCPTLFKQCCGFFYVPQEPDKCKCCETGPTVFRFTNWNLPLTYTYCFLTQRLSFCSKNVDKAQVSSILRKNNTQQHEQDSIPGPRVCSPLPKPLGHRGFTLTWHY